MLKASKLLLPTIIVTLLSACDTANDVKTQPAVQEQAATMPANHPDITQMPQQNIMGDLLGGTVKEAFNGGGYTYVKVEHEGNEIWAAAPESRVQVGQLIGWSAGQSTLMRNFNSKQLSRTFAEIHFTSRFLDPTKMPTEQRANANQHTAASSTQGGEVSEILVGGGYTYVRVAINGQDVWAAGPMIKVNVGESVNWSDGSKMTNFTSSTLKKTFNEVYFVAALNKGAPSNQSTSTQTSAATVSSRGLVTEVITSAGYSYIAVTTNNKQVWLAAPQSNVAKQDKISWSQGSTMHNFQSRSLDKVFEEIIFVDRISII
tara:strand:+ start:28237 stop:29187 length:951 start_codon:yes stop_codon:yes gene_type:complete